MDEVQDIFRKKGLDDTDIVKDKASYAIKKDQNKKVKKN